MCIYSGAINYITLNTTVALVYLETPVLCLMSLYLCVSTYHHAHNFSYKIRIVMNDFFVPGASFATFLAAVTLVTDQKMQFHYSYVLAASPRPRRSLEAAAHVHLPAVTAQWGPSRQIWAGGSVPDKRGQAGLEWAGQLRFPSAPE